MKSMNPKYPAAFECHLRRSATGATTLSRSRNAGECVARIRRVGDRVYIQAQDSEPPIKRNLQALDADTWCEIRSRDSLSVGDRQVALPDDCFQQRPRWNLVGRDIEYRLPSGKTLLQRTDVCILGGRLTAIMGPAGCGKSTLIKSLNGYLKPTAGHVALVRPNAAPIDTHRRPEATRTLLGYVPQETVLLPELTVGYSLDCRLALKYPDMPKDLRMRIAENAVHQLGFDRGKQTRDLLAKRVAVLSGGENRRANIAHELVLQPLVMLLDEPTTGVSAPDAERIVKCLKSLSQDQGIAVAAIIHQPSADVFAQFDDLILMNSHGRVVYHGPAVEACKVLSAFGHKENEPVNPAEVLLDLAHGGRLKSLADHLAFQNRYEKVLGLTHNQGDVLPQVRPEENTSPSWLYALQRLLRRSLRGFRNDRFTIGAAFGQAPLIALLIILAFIGYRDDWKAEDMYARYVTHFQSAYDKVLDIPIPAAALENLEAQDQWVRSLPSWEALHNQATRAAHGEAEKDRVRIAEQHAGQRGAIYFMLVATAIWFGVLGGSREIVCELALLRREVRSGVPLRAWLGAKFMAQALILAVQCALVAGLVVPVLLGRTGISLGMAWLLMWSAGISGISLGLLVSAIAPTYRVALTLVPLLMIPQFLFGGLVRSEARMGTAGRWMSQVTLQRWGFEPFCRHDPYGREGVLQSQVESAGELPETRIDDAAWIPRTMQYRLWFHADRDERLSSERHPLSRMVRFEETGLLAMHLGSGRLRQPDWLPTAIQLAMSALALMACAVLVRRKV